MRARGFTFIEVMVAMLIFVLAVLASINIVRGSVRATRETREITMATWLLQNVMSELEIKLETEGLDKACEKKTEGKFDEPYEKYTWTASCYEVDFKFSETAAKLAAAQSKPEGADENDTSQNAVLKMVLDIASEYVRQSMREIHAEVAWTDGKTPRSVQITTHFARYDQPLGIPGAGGSSGSSSSSSSSGGTSP